MNLFVNACVRASSRTGCLADAYIARSGAAFTELRLEKVDFPIADEAFLAKRDALIAGEKWDDPLFDLARQFARAEEILIAAPYWDLSFPASLKQYFEQINVLGVTFRYTPEGTPVGLCKAKRLTYITTAGGAFLPEEFGFGYVKALAQNFYGIPEVVQYRAAGLDIAGADVAGILRAAEKKIREDLK